MDDDINWLDSFLNSPGSLTPAGNSAIPLSTPVNTSANANNSGSFFSSLISGLTGLGSTALNAYKTVSGTPAPAKPATTISGTTWLVIGGVAAAVLVIAVLLFRRD
jgi:uncharacterized membrane protein YdcZ (DUF606 family)